MNPDSKVTVSVNYSGSGFERDESEHDDFDLVEYARFYGLCEDFTKGNALESVKMSLQPSGDFQESDDPFCTTSLAELEEIGLKERIYVDRDAATHLRWISLLQKQQPHEDEFPQWRQGSALRLKAELPLLKTDHEFDMRIFRHFQSDHALSVPDFPLEELDVEADQALVWSSVANSLPARYDAQFGEEKIAVTREALLHLQSNIKDTFTEKDVQSVLNAALPDRASKASMEPLTPPLLPLSPPQQPCIPSSPVGHLELLSESTDSVAAEARAVEQTLFKQDKIVKKGLLVNSDLSLPDTGDISQVYSPLQSVADAPSSPPFKRARIDDLKVEGPMTPPMTFESPRKRAKSVSFKESLEEYIPELCSATMHKDGISSSSQAEYEKFFDEVIRPIAEDAEKAIQQEQLRGDGNVQRVTVPVLDFSLPEPPWMEFARKPTERLDRHETELECQKRLLSMVRHEIFRDEKPWPGVSRLERQLTWSPFPASLAKVADEDAIQDSGELARLIKGLTVDEVIDSASLTWKPEGLRVLDDDEEDEDDLDEDIFPQEQHNLNSLLRKRKLEIDDEMQIPSKEPFRPITEDDEMLSEPPAEGTQNVVISEIADGVPRPHDSGLMFGGLFSAEKALQNFMYLHGGVAKTSAAKVGPTKQPLPVQKPATVKPLSQVVPVGQPTLPTIHPPELYPVPIPCVPLPTTPVSFIINSQVLHQRHLFRRLEQLFPSANFIERDLAAQTLDAHTNDDTDIILSPSTGLLWTTLQKIKQRPLPGHAAAHHTVKARIRVSAARYERLIVLVSDGAVASNTKPSSGLQRPVGVAHQNAQATTIMTHALSPLDERDALAFTELVAFAACLGDDDEVLVSYVPGGEDALAHWIVSLMARLALPLPSLLGEEGQRQRQQLLLREETLWELFLRRAGMNAYAAQVVLAELKMPSEGGMVEDGGSALAAFVRMGREERVRRFEVVMGGRKVLERVGRVLDSSWISAVGGREEDL
ncbi:MAG: hypothetical protein M1822_006257 [Bathelium mastoideum]|nr:MAG: hypothetical protein M1822_006257 [Bathelium mastoideum]